MKYVVEIDNATYHRFVAGFANENDAGLIEEIFKNAKPLPEGHDDLITKEQAIELVEFYQINPQHFNFVNLIDEIKDEKPIVEADRNEVMQEYESC